MIGASASRAKPAVTNRSGRASRSAAAFVAFLVAGAVSCAALREHTYPPDFQYITRQQIKGRMFELGILVHRLDGLTREPEAMSDHRQELIDVLRQMQETVRTLAIEGVPSNHPLIDANLGAFKDDIRAARLGLERDPPSYIRAASLTAACVYCHGQR